MEHSILLLDFAVLLARGTRQHDSANSTHYAARHNNCMGVRVTCGAEAVTFAMRVVLINTAGNSSTQHDRPNGGREREQAIIGRKILKTKDVADYRGGKRPLRTVRKTRDDATEKKHSLARNEKDGVRNAHENDSAR